MVVLGCIILIVRLSTLMLDVPGAVLDEMEKDV